MQAMMKQVSAIRFSAYAAMAMTLALAITVSAQAQTDASQPTSADLAKRVDDLEKELAAVKAQMAATPAPAPAAAPAATAAVATPAPAAWTRPAATLRACRRRPRQSLRRAARSPAAVFLGPKVMDLDTSLVLGAVITAAIAWNLWMIISAWWGCCRGGRRELVGEIR